MTDWTGWVGTAATDIAKGAAAGSIVPGIGTGIGAAIGLATSLVPALASAVGVDPGVTDKVLQTVQAATSDPAQLTDPDQLAALQAQLAKINADREAAKEAALLERLRASTADIANARQHTTDLVRTGSSLGWGAAVVSVVVLLMFGTAVGFSLLRSVPASDQQLLNVLLGTLAAMATSVVSYWVGSSAGSDRKTGLIAAKNGAAS